MELENILSLSLFLVFFTAYIFKLVILYRKNEIKANVLGKGGKNPEIHKTELFVKTTSLIWGVLWFIFSIMESKVEKLIGPIINVNMLRYIGILVTAFGVCIFIAAMISMKTSWRVGIDKKLATSLITSGVYKYSRNPAFVGLDAMSIGVALTFLNFLMPIVAILNIFAIHRLVLQEEIHLRSAFRDKYMEYISKTPRYVFLKRGVKNVIVTNKPPFS